MSCRHGGPPLPLPLPLPESLALSLLVLVPVPVLLPLHLLPSSTAAPSVTATATAAIPPRAVVLASTTARGGIRCHPDRPKTLDSPPPPNRINFSTSGEPNDNLHPHGDARARGTPAAAVLHLCNTTVGAGVMALPRVVASLGIVLGCAAIAGGAVLQVLSMSILAHASHGTGQRHSYGRLVGHLWGANAARTLDAAVVVNNFGILVIYLASRIADGGAGRSRSRSGGR